MLGDAFSPVLTAAQTGAGWAFERLYRDLAPALTGFARLRGAGDPEGLANEVLAGLFRALPTFSGNEEGLRSLAFTIAYRRLTDERRRNQSRPETTPLGDRDHPGGDVETDALNVLGSAHVRELLDGLTPDQRDVLLLRIVGDMTVESVAQALGKKPNAVKQLQRRGLEVLRRQISRMAVTL